MDFFLYAAIGCFAVSAYLWMTFAKSTNPKKEEPEPDLTELGGGTLNKDLAKISMNRFWKVSFTKDKDV